jgi:hypothetical protein
MPLEVLKKTYLKTGVGGELSTNTQPYPFFRNDIVTNLVDEF